MTNADYINDTCKQARVTVTGRINGVSPRRGQHTCVPLQAVAVLLCRVTLCCAVLRSQSSTSGETGRLQKMSAGCLLLAHTTKLALSQERTRCAWSQESFANHKADSSPAVARFTSIRSCPYFNQKLLCRLSQEPYANHKAHCSPAVARSHPNRKCCTRMPCHRSHLSWSGQPRSPRAA